MTASFFNTGLESLVLVIWGPGKKLHVQPHITLILDESRPVIAVYHFFFTFGGFLAPFLVGLYKDEENKTKECSNRNQTENPTSFIPGHSTYTFD